MWYQQMSKMLLLCGWLALAACSRDAATTVKPVEMKGLVEATLEQMAFVYRNQSYYLIDAQHVVSRKIDELREKKSAYDVRFDVCILGRVVTKRQNKGSGFGHLGQYDKAIEVEGLCNGANAR
ncbi:MAG: hypothetical protein Q4A84_04425 [Neisseria sp.]|uniref:hypothetical protein n=1 Tax=Neisseria sp. TaxID=192066 RepID=UPI0026DB7A87|nr:hypothetical protein [Neisseria sp.]MDO4640934.1 hypothetical protein [Neisseria sp.]